MKDNSNSYIFTLKNIDLDELNNKFNTDIKFENITPLTELNEFSSETISFLDETKQLHNCNLSNIEFYKNIYNCYWCRHEIDTIPLGCPLRYISTQIEKTSKSYNKSYTIKENISRNTLQELNSNIKLITECYYETDGIFCSFNCCQSWINDNKHRSVYDNSTCLLRKMYNDITGNIIDYIKPAPSWRLLDKYGGKLSVREFRNNFNKFDYDFHGTVLSNVSYRPIQYIYENRIKF
jgi:hypothetical protein